MQTRGENLQREPRSMPDDRDQWMTKLLEASLEASGLSVRQLEERLGWIPGTVHQILKREIPCEPGQLLAMLGEISASKPGRNRRRSGPIVTELMERSRRFGYSPQSAAEVELTDPADLDKIVRAALRRAFPALGEEDFEDEE